MLLSSSLLLALLTATAAPVERTQLRQSEHMYWRAINAHQFDLWLGKEEVWRLSTSTSCPALPTEGKLNLLTEHGRFKTQQRIFPAQPDPCHLLSITPLPSNADHTLPANQIIPIEVHGTKGNNKP